MTYDELKYFDGKEGRKAYVAYKGKVYDVTDSPFWKEGDHEGMHVAGLDLTEAMADAPHSDDVFEGFPVVGSLESVDSVSEPTDQPFKERLKRWYGTYHPHPYTVHFPIALHLFAAGLDLMFFADPNEAYAIGVFYTFFIATVGGLIAMVPGILSWWVNYGFIMSRPLVVKLILSIVTLILGVIAIMIYWGDPEAIYSTSLTSMLYHGIVLFTGLTVVVIAYYGGKISWPQQKNGFRAAEVSPSKPIVTERKPSIVSSDKSDLTSFSILIGGAAGTGIQSLEQLLSASLRSAGYYLFSTKEYMSRVRGGSNTTLLRLGDAPVEAACWHVDLVVAIDAKALEHGRARWSEHTVVLADESVGADEARIIHLPIRKTASELGSFAYANTYVAGAIFGLLGLEASPLHTEVLKRFSKKNPEENAKAAREGLAYAQTMEKPPLLPLPKPMLTGSETLQLMNGTTATGFGFLAGGCNFIASYPMSPSTGVLNFMATMSKEFDIALEQSEDEIAALNMVLGAWYAGARGVTTTSGGGFALMGETVSLAGATETPAVIYLAQRPGPATGMPTRSEQGDLNMAIYSGHGDFNRIVLAPGSLRECIDYGHFAFELADRYQLPVIVLSDQYLADSGAFVEQVDFTEYGQQRHTVPTQSDYRRYDLSGEGISPRGVPGVGEGLVSAVGHEHNERAQSTEDYRVREAMVAKRLAKREQVIKQVHPPVVTGEGTIAIVGWGSSKGVITEALHRLGDARLYQVHFAWVHPLNRERLGDLKDAETVIVVENNATGQFADQLVLHGVEVHHRILQANGFAFFADQLDLRIAEVLKDLK